jgi:hypothetical protein
MFSLEVCRTRSHPEYVQFHLWKKIPFSNGLPQIRLSALKAAASLIKYSDSRRIVESFAPLMLAILEVLPSLAATKSQPRLSSAFVALVDLFSHRPAVRLLAPHLPTLIDFLLSLIADPSWDDSVRHLAIEMLVTLAEQGGKVLFVDEQADGWAKITRTLLSLMSTVHDDSNWEFEEVVTSAEDEEQTSVVAEQALDRLALVGASSRLLPVRMLLLTLWALSVSQRREDRPSHRLCRHSCVGAVPVVAGAPCRTLGPWNARRSMHRGHEPRAEHHGPVSLHIFRRFPFVLTQLKRPSGSSGPPSRTRKCESRMPPSMLWHSWPAFSMCVMVILASP